MLCLTEVKSGRYSIHRERSGEICILILSEGHEKGTICKQRRGNKGSGAQNENT